MEKIRLKPNETAVITANNTTYVLGGDVSIEIKGNTGDYHPEPKRLLTVEEIVNEESGNEGWFITDHNVEYYGLSPYGRHFRDAATKEQAEKLVALAEIMRIADYYNEHYADGWKADWDDTEQVKYMIYSNLSSVVVNSLSLSDIGLPCFATEELAQLALDNNREVFERFFAVEKFFDV